MQHSGDTYLNVYNMDPDGLPGLPGKLYVPKEHTEKRKAKGKRGEGMQDAGQICNRRRNEDGRKSRKILAWGGILIRWPQSHLWDTLFL